MCSGGDLILRCPCRPLHLLRDGCRASLRSLERGSEKYEAVKKEVNLRSAKRLLHVCSTHGGVYTKFGQHIASLNHVLPREYTETLKVLQDSNPRSVSLAGSRHLPGSDALDPRSAARPVLPIPSSRRPCSPRMCCVLSVGVDEVARTVRMELGAEVEELFEEFDERAIAAASLAQVRRTRSGVLGRGGVGWRRGRLAFTEEAACVTMCPRIPEFTQRLRASPPPCPSERDDLYAGPTRKRGVR